jgi:hypothetical protein
MTNASWERWARATGIVFVFLFIVSFIVYGDQPKLGASTSDIVSFYDGNRGRILAATFIFGVAILFLLWFVAAIASALREAGQGGWGAATIASGAVLAGILFLLNILSAGLANTIAGNGDEGVITALSDLSWTVAVTISFPASLVIAAASIGLWRAGIIADWFGWAGIAAAIAVLLGGTTWATDGFWAPDGAYSRYVTMIVALAWTLVASVLLYMRAPATAPMPERAAIPTT